MRHTYVAVFEEEDVGGFFVHVPDLPGCFSQGDDLPHALDMIAEAMELWITSLILDGHEVPAPSSDFACSDSPLRIAVSVETDPKTVTYVEMYMTVNEAAETLGVTRGRVHQLIATDQLWATKRGRDLFVESESVYNRIASEPRPGRPSKTPSPASSSRSASG